MTVTYHLPIWEADSICRYYSAYEDVRVDDDDDNNNRYVTLYDK